jgi:hypothetical protein
MRDTRGNEKMQETVTGRHLKGDHVKKIPIFRGGMLLAGALLLGASLCPAQTGAITQVAQTDPNITYTGVWAPDTLAVGGPGIISDQSAARASFGFTGTGITWIGDSGYNRGVARIYLDGTTNTVDTYSATWLDQQMLFVAKGLTPGLHTFSIDVTQLKNVNAGDPAISVEAFDIQNGTTVPPGTVMANPGYIEQNNPAVTYTGNWYLNTSPYESGGSAALAVDPGATATVLFNGTGITWIGYMDPWSGLAEVYVDGVAKITSLDTYAAPYGTAGSLVTIWQPPIWGITGLPNGPHTLTIEVLGQFCCRSAGAWVWVDAFRILGPTASGQ